MLNLHFTCGADMLVTMLFLTIPIKQMIRNTVFVRWYMLVSKSQDWFRLQPKLSKLCVFPHMEGKSQLIWCNGHTRAGVVPKTKSCYDAEVAIDRHIDQATAVTPKERTAILFGQNTIPCLVTTHAWTPSLHAIQTCKDWTPAIAEVKWI